MQMNKKSTGNTNGGRATTQKKQQNQNKSRSNTQKQGSGKVRQQSGRGQLRYAALNQARVNTSMAPRGMSNKKPIEHTEFLGNVIAGSSGVFEVFSRFRVNPASIRTFPWLSRQAIGWESYVFKKLHIRYENIANAGTDGTVSISPDYDASDGAILETLSESQVYNNVDTVTGSVWTEFVCKLDPRKMNRLYKSHTTMSDARFSTTKQDEKTVDAAQVFVFTDASPGTRCGKLFVDYIVELQTPQAISEDVNSGGQYVTMTNPTSGSNAPVTSSAAETKFLAETNPILRKISEIPGMTYPSANIGQLTQDWQGILNLATATSSSLASLNGMLGAEISKDKNAGYGAGVPLAAAESGANSRYNFAGGTNNRVQNSFVVDGKAGDYIKFSTPVVTGAITTLTELLAQFGAGSVNTIEV